MVFICIWAGFLLLNHVHCENYIVIELEKLTPKPELNGRSCAVAETVVQKPNALGLVYCAARCQSIVACRSFFYSNVTKHCEGCSQKYGNTTLLPLMDGTLYMYRKAPQTTFNITSYSISQERLTFSETQTYCNDIGGYILQIGSAEENQFAADLMGDIGDYWLGLTDEQVEGNWLWLKPDKATGYTNWKPNSVPSDPENHRPIQNCAAVIVTASYQWGDQKCSSKNYVLCELL